MTNIDEIKAIASFSYHSEWAADTILSLCDEVEKLTAANKIMRDFIKNQCCSEHAVKYVLSKVDEVMAKYRKSEG